MHTNTTVELPAVRDLPAIAAENNPDRVAYGAGPDGRTVTWEEFDAAANRAANALKQHVAQGDRVAFLCDCSIEHVTLWTGAAKAGCIVSNVHTRAAPQTLQYCLEELRPRVLVVDPDVSEVAQQHVYDELAGDISVVVSTGEERADREQAYEEWVTDHPATEPDVRAGEDDIAAIVWTSGTTGRPKGWCHTNRGLVLKGLKNSSMTRTSRIPQLFTPSFAAWYASTIPAMVANASLFFLRDWDPRDYLRLIQERQLTTGVLVPTMWREIMRLDDLDAYDLKSLEHITASGERLDVTTLERLREHICEDVTNGYAATEVMGASISGEELDSDHIESVGKPRRGTRIRVVEAGGAPDDTKPPGELGEIIVKGADCAVWAWGNTAKTEAVFEDGWWYSGDLGYKDEEGFLYLEGRTDFMIMSKGMKVFPTPVEERLNAHPDVEEAAVIGIEDEEYGEMVTAVVQRLDDDLSADDLDEWCLESEELARYERPRDYLFVEEQLPRTASGKLDRRSTKTQYVD